MEKEKKAKKKQNTEVGFVPFLRSLMKAKDLTYTELSERTGLPYRTIVSITEHGNPTLDSLEKIALALRIDLPDLFAYQSKKVSVLEKQAEIDEVIEKLKELKTKI